METDGKTSPQATSEATPERAAEDRSPEESPEDRSEDTPEEEPEDVPLSMEDRRGLLQGVLSKKSDAEDGDVGEEERTPSEDGSPDRGKRTDPPPPPTSPPKVCEQGGNRQPGQSGISLNIWNMSQ